jgi:hypothetical protein
MRQRAIGLRCSSLPLHCSASAYGCQASVNAPPHICAQPVSVRGVRFRNEKPTGRDVDERRAGKCTPRCAVWDATKHAIAAARGNHCCFKQDKVSVPVWVVLGGRGRGVKRRPTHLGFACSREKPTIADANVKTSNMSCSNAPILGGWSDTV